MIETFVKESPWHGLGIVTLTPDVVDMSFTFAQAAPFRAGIENVGTRNKTVWVSLNLKVQIILDARHL